jgi:hypothetical protein
LSENVESDSIENSNDVDLDTGFDGWKSLLDDPDEEEPEEILPLKI